MKTDWSQAKDGVIDVPDELMPLVNKIGIQIRFHTISRKDEVQTVCDILSLTQDFFIKHPELLKKGKT